MRLFVAVYPPRHAVDDLAGFVEHLHVGKAAASGINTRLASPDTYHLTLAFLGEVDDDRLPDAEGAVDRALARAGPEAGPGAGPGARPELRLAGGGRFGRGKFTILWCAVDGDLDPMRRLHRALRRELKRARLPYDEKPWKPHLTLARPGDRVTRAQSDADRAALHEYAGPSWPVRELVLMRSHLGPKPTYDRLRSWPL